MARRWVRVGAATVGGVAAGTMAVAAIGAARWNHASARMVERLRSASRDSSAAPKTFSSEELAGLPAPVARYFGFALTPGQPLIERARVRWAGGFRLAPNAKWRPFTAVQHVTVQPPGFVWDATISMAPLLSVRVRDGYVEGEGIMLGKLAAVVPVADQRGTPGMAAGALSRYLGEAVWFPTALMPAAGVSWDSIDDTTARVTITDGPTSVSAEVRFGPDGEIFGMSMNRYRDVKGRGVVTPFDAQLRDYRRVSGMMIPTEGEVAWMLPEGRFAYWRGRPTDIDYDPPR